MRLRDEQALRDIASGSAVLGTGGGGDPYLGTLVSLQALARYGPMRLVTADELDDEALVVLPFSLGSPVPLIEKFPLSKEMVQAYETINRCLHGRVKAVMPDEIGGINSMVPFCIAAQLGIPVVDGDCMGRAYPEIQLVTLTMHGISACPFAIADEHGNSVVLYTIDNLWAERFAHLISVDIAICAGVAFPITGKQVRNSRGHELRADLPRQDRGCPAAHVQGLGAGRVCSRRNGLRCGSPYRHTRVGRRSTRRDRLPVAQKATPTAARQAPPSSGSPPKSPHPLRGSGRWWRSGAPRPSPGGAPGAPGQAA